VKMLLYISAVLLVFAGSGFSADANAVKPSVPDLAAAKQFANSFEDIARGVMDSKNPDWAKIEAQFQLTLPVIKDIDAKYNKSFEQTISTAIEKLASGKSKPSEFNNIIVEKSYGQVTVFAIQQELDLMGKATPADMKAGAEKVAAYFEVIRPIYDDIFESEKGIEKQADKAIAKLQKANKSELLMASRQLEDVLAKTYAVSVLFEASEAVDNIEKDPLLADRHQLEAMMCYEIIQPRIEKHSPKTNEKILTMLKGKLNTINVEELEKNLETGLGMKLRSK
jgi:hypothetical protein